MECMCGTFVQNRLHDATESLGLRQSMMIDRFFHSVDPRFSGSRLVTYNPRFDMISSKSSLCKAQNKASSELRVDFRFVPPCFVAESDVLDASIQVRAREAAGDNSMWVAKKDQGMYELNIYHLVFLCSRKPSTSTLSHGADP